MAFAGAHLGSKMGQPQIKPGERVTRLSLELLRVGPSGEIGGWLG
jgi:hypothetical protein